MFDTLTSLVSPRRQIESALRGTIYDPYIRFIAKEGLLGWWKDDYPSWSLCPGAPESALGNQLPLTGKPPIPDDPDLPVCPSHWAEPLHGLNCEVTFPPELDTPNPDRTVFSRIMGAIIPEYLELNTPQYAGHIKDIKLVEKLLAMGGVRLAAVLNDLFDPERESVSVL